MILTGILSDKAQILLIYAFLVLAISMALTAIALLAINRSDRKQANNPDRVRWQIEEKKNEITAASKKLAAK